MDIKDLQPGDVLLFSPEEGSFISQAIAWLTGEPVSHAAMAYEPPSLIVEETPPEVQTNPAADRFVGRTITVMRRSPPQSSYDPVLEAASGYLNESEPYAEANLYLVGMLLIYRKFTPDSTLQRIIIRILKKVTASIITYYNEHEYPGKLPMVCSQFVFQCYGDAGANYQLRIVNGVLGDELGLRGEMSSLLDQAIARVRSDSSPAFQGAIAAHGGMALRAPEVENGEVLARELLQAIQPPPAFAAAAPAPLQEELVVAIHEFAQAVQRLRTGTAPPGDELLQANRNGVAPNGMAMLKTEEGYFVTPADLLAHCPTLQQVGTIQV
jgi:hypothetical protein